MTTTNDAPAPAPSGSGVREEFWTPVRISHVLADCATYFRTLYVRHAIGPGHQGIDPDKLDAASRAAASLASDASPVGEAVAWAQEGYIAALTRYGSFPMRRTKDEGQGYVVPLYAHPEPATVEIGDAKTLAKALRWFLKYPEFMPSPEYFDEMLADIRAARPISAALAPATGGRKG